MLKQLQADIPYRFNQVKLLEAAMTHTSAANEAEGAVAHNERLEFLGDAVLEVCISSLLYNAFPDAREGELTALRSKLVNQQNLAKLAKQLMLDTYLVLGKGEDNQGGRTKETLLSDAFEALLGAIYLDGGFLAAEKVIAFLFADAWTGLSTASKVKDHKSLLQEMTQRLFKDRPTYSLMSCTGPEHDKVFTVLLRLPDGQELEGTGSSVKRAEQHAAGTAITLLESQDA